MIKILLYPSLLVKRVSFMFLESPPPSLCCGFCLVAEKRKEIMNARFIFYFVHFLHVLTYSFLLLDGVGWKFEFNYNVRFYFICFSLFGFRETKKNSEIFVCLFIYLSVCLLRRKGKIV